jgi:DNA sulfur modification protein DndD
MLLSKIALHNFSAFEGTQVVELTATNSPQQNITLIGAMNGAGKTSLLDAVKLCLYGERGNGFLNNKEIPAEFIRKRFNYNARDRHETEMWIELVLDNVELPGATHQIQVRRTWHFHSTQGTNEGDEFTIIKDGKELQIITREHWQDFINDTIPPGVADFFFFDGEKIQQLADDTDDHPVLRESIRNLLGLTVYNKLSSDLDKHIEGVRRKADKVTTAQLSQLEADEARTERRIRENRQQLDVVRAELGKLLEQDEHLDEEVRRIMGVGVDSRSRSHKKATEAESQKRNVNDEILRVAGELLPFAIAGKICDELRAQLEAEEKLRQWEAAKAYINSQLERLAHKIFYDKNGPNPKRDITPAQRAFYAKRLNEEWETLFIPKPLDASDILLHEISAKDERLILDTLDRVSEQTLGKLKGLLKQREHAAKRWQRASRELRNPPEEGSHVNTLFDQRRVNEERKQQLNREVGRLDDDYVRLERELKTIKEKIVSLKQRLEQTGHDRYRVSLARKVQDTLVRYERVLQQRKLTELENLTTEMYRRLARKNDFVGQVKIDPNTFEVTVHDTLGRIREKRSLSAGEKQIYAISLLWGLAKASDAELPIIIDTPFARLDSEHRTKIAEHYFPHASGQIIVLSTDEEVDQEYIDLLRPYIGRTYLIEHQDAERRSIIKTGYFQDAMQAKSVKKSYA